jgi:DeoR family transcriptional regulator, fructose operon transcriptional repressor
MEKRRQSATDRHSQLIMMLKTRGYCSITELSQLLNVSAMTIRRDLHVLQEKQIVEVTYGGAHFTGSKQTEPNFDIRAREQLAEKQAIGRRAAELFVEEGDIVGIDSGSTMLEIARNLPDVPLTVVTPSLPVANIVSQNRRHALIMLGGVLQNEGSFFYGPQVMATLRTLYINKLFLGTSGLLLPDGLSSSNLPDAEVKQALINAARRVILCMDSSKISRVFLARFSALDAINTLVTDDGITDEDYEAIVKHQVQVITVSTLSSESAGLSLVNAAQRK